MENRGVVCARPVCNVTSANCDGEIIFDEGMCCPICAPRQPPVEECLREENNMTITVTIDDEECISLSPVLHTSCGGSCGSSADTMFTEPYLMTDCKCCKPASLTEKTILVDCASGTKEHTYMEIDACACEECVYNPFEATTTAPEIVY